MRRYRRYTVVTDDAPDNWIDHVVWLWHEDDARPVDRERVCDAFRRITGHHNRDLHKVAYFDGGDCMATLYRGGWVSGSSCEGGLVGVLIEVLECKDKP